MARITRTIRGYVELDEAGNMLRVVGVLSSQDVAGIPQNLHVVEVSDDFVELAWADVGDASSWLVFRDDIEIDEIGVPTYIDNTVSADTTYTYAVKAKNTAGTSAFSSSVVVETEAQSGPDVPTGLDSPSATARVVQLTWDNAADAAEWDVFRNLVYIETVLAPSFEDDTVAPSTTYSYQVLARNATGDSAPCSALEVETPANSPPVWNLSDQLVPSNTAYSLDLRTVCLDPDGHTLSFSLASGTVPGVSVIGNFLTGVPTSVDTDSITLRANDGFVNVDITIDFEVFDSDSTAPTTPSNVNATATGSTVTVTFTGSSDASGISHYNVFRGGAFRGTTTASPFVENGVPDGSHTYSVTAVDNSANANESAAGSDPSPVVVSTTPPNPDTPINFLLNVVSSSRIDSTWAAGPSGPAPTSYEIDRSLTGSNPQTPGAAGWSNVFTGLSLSDSDTGLTASTQYHYRIRAMNGISPSNSYAVATASTLATSGAIALQTLRDAGYIIVTDSPYNADPTGVADSTAEIQDAVDDGYAQDRPVWFPSGTYKISSTIRCYRFMLTVSGSPPEDTHQLIGASAPSRPILKLAAGASGFSNAGSPRPMLAYAQWKSSSGTKSGPPADLTFNPYDGPSGTWQSNTPNLFRQYFFNIDFDTSGHAGADGLNMFTAQGAFCGNVRVVATGSNVGIRGTPGRNGGCVNLEVEGGDVGYSTDAIGTQSGAAGACVAGLRCLNQTGACVEFGDFVPTTIVGFEFSKASGGSVFTGNPSGSNTALNAGVFIDGKVTTTGTAFDNTNQVGLYIRNVWVTGTNNLVKTGGTTTTGSGTWKLINEYVANRLGGNVVNPGAGAGDNNLQHFELINGTTTRVSNSVANVTSSASVAPSDIVTRHVYDIPMIDGGTYIDITDAPYNATSGSSDSRSKIQQAIDDAATAGHNRVFIPRGTFNISGTVNLKANTKMFGMGIQGYTVIYPHSSWTPASGVSPFMISTANNAAGTAFFGFVTLRMRASSGDNGHFSHLQWRTGRYSATACVDYDKDFVSPSVANLSWGRTVLEISGNGGGRHYAATADGRGNNGTNFRVVKITGTTEPLHMYGLNVEAAKLNPGGTTPLTNVEITDAANARLYSMKREGDAPTVVITDSTNIGVFSGGGMLNAEGNYNQINGDSSGILFAQILVQKQDSTASGTTIRENVTGGGGVKQIGWPNGCSLYKRGTLDDTLVAIS